jgi:hypothetical protein
MRRIFLQNTLPLLISALLALGLASAQTTNTPEIGGQAVEAKVLMPSTVTQVTVSGKATNADVQVIWATISNPGASPTTFTLQDGDGASYAMFTDCPIAANTTYSVPLPTLGLKFTGGVFVKSASAALVFRFQGRVR